MFIVRDAGDVPFFLPPTDWHLGDETALTHALVEADPAAVDELWAIRRDDRRVAEFIVERERPRLRAALSRREPVDGAKFEEVMGFLEREVPRLRPLWSSLDREAIPVLLWDQLTAYAARWQRHVAFRTAENEALFQHRGLAEHLLLLLDPGLATFGARYEDRKTMLQAAILTLAREPLRDLGVRERATALRPSVRRLLSRRAAREAFVALDTFWIVRPEEAGELRRRLAERGDMSDEDCLAVDGALARVDGTFLMTVTKWAAFAWAVGGEIDHGVSALLRVVPYRGGGPP